MAVHTIANKDLSVSVNSSGAELISLTKNDTELMWQSDKNVWARYAPVLFPVVGKLKDNHFIYEGSAYKMNQHGFARDKEFVLAEKNDGVLEFELTDSEETLSVYPFHFSLKIRYELKGEAVSIKYKVFNSGDKSLLFGIGAHPGFNCKKLPGESLNDYYLEIPDRSSLVAEKLADGLQSGETYEVKLHEGKLRLNASLFDNDALVFKNYQIEKITLASDKSPHKLTLGCKGWPYFGIWTKKGSDAFVCLEPWYGIADSVKASGKLNEKEGIMELSSQQQFECQYTIAV